MKVDDDISELESKRDFDGLVKHLSSKSERAKGLAANALGRLGDPSYLPYLEKLLSQEGTSKSSSASNTSDCARWAVGVLKSRQKTPLGVFSVKDLAVGAGGDVLAVRRYPSLRIVAQLYRFLALLMLLIIPIIIYMELSPSAILIVSLIVILNVLFAFASAELIELLISIESHVVKIAKRK
jgi:hypothetical protein